ncbi:MAG: M56 family metallopeptidase [Gemmatimonadaceae bacterium]
MTASWMLSCLLWAACMAAAAWLIERLFLAARLPVRNVWLVAMAASVAGPVLSGSVLKTRSFSAATVVAAQRAVAVPARPNFVRLAAARERRIVAAVPRRASGFIPGSLMPVVRALRYDGLLAALWIASSLALIAYIAGGIVHLRNLRRDWRSDTVDGVPVMVSTDTGPAVVGLFSAEIVIPEQALWLDKDERGLMLQHELEHLAANDSVVAAVAQAIVVLMPWNPLVWWQLRRLRVAAELDCDARVLNVSSDVAAYGRLLLDFRVPRPIREFAGVGFTSHAAELERRIRCLARRPTVDRPTAIVSSLAAAALAFAVAGTMPSPARGAERVARGTAAPKLAQRRAPLRVAVPKFDPKLADTARLLNLFGKNYRAAAPALASSPTVESTAGAQGGPESGDSLVTIRWENAPISEVLAAFERFSGRTIRISPAVTGSISANMMKQPWRAALEQVMRANGYGLIFNDDGSIDVDTLVAVVRQRVSSSLAAMRAQRTTSDAAVAQYDAVGCSASPDPTGQTSITLLLSDENAAHSGQVLVKTEVQARGTQLEFYPKGSATPSHTCSGGPGTALRLFGRAALEGRIVVRLGAPATFTVATGSGRQLADAVKLVPGGEGYSVGWQPAKP